MQQTSTYLTPAQKEAFLNEYKGTLLEYLVGLFLARQYSFESDYRAQFSPLQLKELQDYQQMVMQMDPELYQKLFSFAQEILKNLNFPAPVQAVIWTGKNKERKQKDEADLLVRTEDSLSRLSLKLCRYPSFVNTKSGGLKSFLGHYFSDFSQSHFAQNEFNHFCGQRFNEFSFELHKIYHLEEKSDFSDWNQLKKPRLPSELNEEALSCLYSYYHDIICQLYLHLKKFFDEDRPCFEKCLYPLLGFSHDDVKQVFCLYEHSKQQRYLLRKIIVKQIDDLKAEFDQMEILPPEKKNASLHLKTKHLLFQIRVKPMNTFTAPSLKVNCSLQLS